RSFPPGTSGSRLRGGRNLVIEYRNAEGRQKRFPVLAAELVALRVDVIIAPTTRAALAAKQATSSIPIVSVSVSDPVGSGLVSSLARPGGNERACPMCPRTWSARA